MYAGLNSRGYHLYLKWNEVNKTIGVRDRLKLCIKFNSMGVN